MRTVYEVTQGKWAGILAHHGVDTSGKHGPCPVCGGTDRFRFDDKEGEGTWICSHCGAGKGLQLLMAVTGQDFKAAAQEAERLAGVVQPVTPKPPSDPRPMLRKIRGELISAEDNPDVVAYLQSRNLPMSPALKAHKRMPYYEDKVLQGHYPAMVALIKDADCNPLTYHVTYLDQGKKAQVRDPKKTMPKLKPGVPGAIRLFPYTDTLGIAEGIETALACFQRDGVPTWAGVSDWGLANFIPPDNVKTLVIYGDNDKSFAGQAAAYALAKREAQRRHVFVAIPETPGDWAD